MALAFLPPSIKPHHGTACSERAGGLIAAAAHSTGLVFRSRVKDTACLALPIFIFRTDNKDLEAIDDHAMATPNSKLFWKMYRRRTMRIYSLWETS